MENNTTGSSSSSQFPNPFVLIKDGAVFAYKNFWKLLIIIFVPVIAFGLVEVVFVTLERSVFEAGTSDLTIFSQPHTVIISTIIGVLLLVIECVFIGSIISYIAKKDRGQTTGVVDSWKIGFSKCWPLFCAIFILELCFVTSGLLLIIPAIALAFYAMFLPFAVIVDGHKDLDALVASYVTVRGAWWRTLGYYLFLVLIGFALEVAFGFAMAILFSIIGIVRVIFHSASPILFICVGIVLALVAIAVGTFAIAIATHYFYSYFKSLKSRKASTFEAEFKASRPVARKVFGTLAIIGFMLIVAFYASGLYGKYVSFIQALNARAQQQQSMNAHSFAPSIPSQSVFPAATEPFPGKASGILQRDPIVDPLGYSIHVPQGWNLSDTAEDASQVRPADESINIVLFIQKLKLNQKGMSESDESIANDVVQLAQNTDTALKNISYTVYELNSQKVYSFSGSSIYKNDLYYSDYYVFADPSGPYLLQIIASEKEHAFAKELLLSAISTFKAEK